MIRKAEEKDISALIGLLHQVLEIHASLMPDLFVSGTTKYTEDELRVVLKDPETPVYVFTDDEDRVLGYAFCALREREASSHLRPGRDLYLDDLCVDKAFRGRHIGQQLLRHVEKEAEHFGCERITLNVWEGNDDALAFYQNAGFLPVKTRMDLLLRSKDRKG